MYTHVCNKCHKVYETDHKRGWVCGDCQKKRYIMATSQKSCGKCGKAFVGTYRQRFCQLCRLNRGAYSFKNTYMVRFVCKHCGKLLKTERRNKTKDVVNMINCTRVCDECKRTNRTNTSIRMTYQNPSFHGKPYDQVIKERAPKRLPDKLNKFCYHGKKGFCLKRITNVRCVVQRNVH